jgi:hypothetical protein
VVIHAFVFSLLLCFVIRIDGCWITPIRAIALIETGPKGDDGEKGRSGSGGTEVEVALEGEQRDRMGAGHPERPAVPETPQAPEPSATAPQAPPTAQHDSTNHERQNDNQNQRGARNDNSRETHPPREREPAEAPPPAPAEPRGASDTHNDENAHAQPSQPSTASPGAPGGGTGEFLRNSGLRPGSVGQQRAILPRAVHCDDEVAGIWRAQKYDPVYGDWMLATLFMHRGASNELHGTMVVHQWDGGPFQIRPPVCGPFGFDFVVDEPADGFATGRRVDFGAHSWRLREIRCNGGLRALDYHPDHFTGTIDPEREEFQSVNNDGGRAVNDPMVFRRIACLDQPDGANGNSSVGTGASGSGNGSAPALDPNHPPSGQ